MKHTTFVTTWLLFWLLVIFGVCGLNYSPTDSRYVHCHKHHVNQLLYIQPATEPLSVQVESLGVLRITGYRSVPEQCKPDPFYTSIGVHTNRYIVAVSQDLLKSGQLKYNDIIYIDGVGSRIVADAMGKTRHYVIPVRGSKLAVRLFIPQRRSVDVWCETYEQEKHLGISHRRVWIIHTNLKGNIGVPKETAK